MKSPEPLTTRLPGCFGAEHRVRTGDLRLGNESARHSRISTILHESARTFDFIGLRGVPRRVWLHESSRGFSSFMCPACAWTFVSSLVRRAPERASSGAAAGLLARARLRTVRTQRAAALQGLE